MEKYKFNGILIAICFILVSSQIISTVYAPPIFVSVSGKIQGRVDHTNHSAYIYKEPQVILTNIYNVGSTGCVVKVRVDFYKSSKHLKTTWSEIEAMEPGATFLFHNYWIPDEEGNITAKTKIYQCYEVFTRDEITFKVGNKSIQLTEDVGVVESENTRNKINLTIVSNKTLEDVLIIPSEYPLGWIVEHGRINKIAAGEEKTITIEYEASTWHEEKIKFDILTIDGSEHTQYIMQLEKEIPVKDGIQKETAIIILLAGIVLLFIENYRLKKRIKKRTNKSDNKKSNEIKSDIQTKTNIKKHTRI